MLPRSLNTTFVSPLIAFLYTFPLHAFKCWIDSTVDIITRMIFIFNAFVFLTGVIVSARFRFAASFVQQASFTTLEMEAFFAVAG